MFPEMEREWCSDITESVSRSRDPGSVPGRRKHKIWIFWQQTSPRWDIHYVACRERGDTRPIRGYTAHTGLCQGVIMTPGVQRAEIMINDRIQIHRIIGKKGFGFEKSKSWPFLMHSIAWPAQWDARCNDELYLLYLLPSIVWCSEVVDLLWWPDIIVVWGVSAITMLQCTGRCNKTQSWDLIRIVSGHSAARCLLLWQIKMRDAGKILKLSLRWCLELVIQQKSTRLAI